MTRYAPLWQQEGAYNAIQDRQLIQGIWTNGGVQGAAITLSASAMTASIAPGICVVPMTAVNGNEFCYWDAAEVVTFTAANATNPRIDLIVCQVRDDAIDTGGQNSFSFVVVTGTAAASPTPPATPVNSFVVAQVRIPANVTNLSTATLPFLGNLLDGGAQQAPVAAGAPFQSMIDSEGNVWVAKGGVYGGVWKLARDVLHSRLTRSAVYTSTNNALIAFDTLDSDVYGLFSIGTSLLTCPLAGMYLVTAATYLTSTGANQGTCVMVQRNGSVKSRGSQPYVSGSGMAMQSTIATVVACVAGDTLGIMMSCNAGLTSTYGDPANNWASFSYLGTG